MVSFKVIRANKQKRGLSHEIGYIGEIRMNSFEVWAIKK